MKMHMYRKIPETRIIDDAAAFSVKMLRFAGVHATHSSLRVLLLSAERLSSTIIQPD
ncbi:MAG: hypothetical protein LUQ40_02475 [Methanomicrobiales archaeon]|nr:hypothetical protein [Methanomicrobiales archaeon]